MAIRSDGEIEQDVEGAPQREMSPERAKDRADVLAAMEAGEDKPDKVKRSRRAEERAKGSSKVAKSLKDPEKEKGKGRAGSDLGEPARPNVGKKRKPIVADADDPANDDPDDYSFDDDDDEDGIVPGTEDRARPKKKPARQPASRDDDDDDDDQDDGDTDVDAAPDDDDQDDDEDGDDDDDHPAGGGVDDPKVKGAIRKIAQAEKRSKERVRELDQQRRQEFESQRSAFLREWEPKVKAVQVYDEMVSRAKTNPVGAALDFARNVCKIDGDDWELLGKNFFLQSPRAQQDPQKREAALRALQQVQSKSELQEVKEQNAALMQKLEQREQREEAERLTRRFLRRATRAVSDTTPLSRRLLKNDPEEFQAKIHALSVELAERSDDGLVPSPERLVRAFEKRQRRELAKLGIDPDRVLKKKRAAAEPDEEEPAQKKAPGQRTATQKNGQQQNGAQSPKRGRALKDDVLSALEAGNFR